MARRSVTFTLLFGLVAVMAVTGIVLAVSGLLDDFALGGRIAVLPVEGLIADDQRLLEQLETLREDPTVQGFVVAINSPGGVVAPSQSLYAQLRELRESDDRPVIASIGAVGASGGYYVALGADSVLALPGSITGSIGVIMQFPNATDLLDKIGVGFEIVKSAEYKDVGSPSRDMSESDRAMLSALVQDVYEQFMAVVAFERDLPIEEVRRLADGRIMSGRQAVEAGLIDRTGNLDDAIELAGRMAGLGEDPAVRYPPEQDMRLLDLLLGRGTASLVGALGIPFQRVGPQLMFVTPY
ncbi:MAG: signal peptide peptidase SppA [Longimicrobiales bacterium]